MRTLLALAAICALAACNAPTTRPPDEAAVAIPDAAAAPVSPSGSPQPAPPAPVLDAQQSLPADFIVSTNEPFWTATVEDGKVVLKGMDDERTLVVESNNALFDGRSVVARDTAGMIELRVTGKACQDDMSGADFPYTGKLSIDGGGEIMGCARPASEPPPGEPPPGEPQH